MIEEYIKGYTARESEILMQIVDSIEKNKEEFRDKIIEAKENKEIKAELE